MNEALGKLTSHEWGFVQETWDTLGKLRPALGELEVRLTGIEPKWVEASPFTIKTSDGVEMTLKGGYWPIKYDSSRDTHGLMQDTNLLDLTDKGFLAPNTPNGFTVPRTKYKGPLLLDYESILTRHLAQVIHRVTHQEALSDIWKLFKDDTVRKAVNETRGEEYMHLLDGWLRHVANDRNGTPADALSRMTRASFHQSGPTWSSAPWPSGYPPCWHRLPTSSAWPPPRGWTGSTCWTPSRTSPGASGEATTCWWTRSGSCPGR